MKNYNNDNDQHGDEDIDITAIYVLGDKQVDLHSEDASEMMQNAINRSVREALLKHKRAGNPVPVERDGKIVYLQPDDIPAD